MFFFFRPSTITVDVFCADEIIFHNFKPERANKFLPKFWKELPPYLDQKAIQNPHSKLMTKVGTLKKCVGFTDLFSNGFILPNWADWQNEVLPSGVSVTANFNSEDVNSTFSGHGRTQFGEPLYKNCGHIKIDSPWLFKEKTGVKFTWNGCPWHNTDALENFYVLSAIVNYKNQIGTNVNAFQRKGSIVQFTAGDPLIHLVPMSEKKVKIAHHQISQQEWHNMNSREMIALRYKDSRAVKAKCPF